MNDTMRVGGKGTRARDGQSLAMEADSLLSWLSASAEKRPYLPSSTHFAWSAAASLRIVSAHPHLTNHGRAGGHTHDSFLCCTFPVFFVPPACLRISPVSTAETASPARSGRRVGALGEERLTASSSSSREPRPAGYRLTSQLGWLEDYGTHASLLLPVAEVINLNKLSARLALSTAITRERDQI